MKNQIKLIAVLACLPIFLFGQNKFSWGINASTELSMMQLESTSPIDRMENGAGALGYSIGTNVSYQLSPELYLRSGLNYEQSTYRHQINGLRFGSDIINRTESRIENDLSVSTIVIPLDVGCSK